MDTLGKMKFR